MDKNLLLEKIKSIESYLRELYTGMGGEDIKVDLTRDEKIVITTSRGSVMIVDVGNPISSISVKAHEEDEQFFDLLSMVIISAITDAIKEMRRREYLKNKLN